MPAANYLYVCAGYTYKRVNAQQPKPASLARAAVGTNRARPAAQSEGLELRNFQRDEKGFLPGPASGGGEKFVRALSSLDCADKTPHPHTICRPAKSLACPALSPPDLAGPHC